MVERNGGEPPQPEGPRSFTRMLETLNDGVLVHELSLETFKLVKMLLESAREGGQGATAKGELTLVLKYEVGNDMTIDINPEIKRKEPKKRRNSTTAWVTAGGNISFDFPKQHTLPGMSVVTGGASGNGGGRSMPPPRSIGAAAAAAGTNEPDDEDDDDSDEDDDDSDEQGET